MEEAGGDDVSELETGDNGPRGVHAAGSRTPIVVIVIST
jgi:hypothetical protein